MLIMFLFFVVFCSVLNFELVVFYLIIYFWILLVDNYKRDYVMFVVKCCQDENCFIEVFFSQEYYIWVIKNCNVVIEFMLDGIIVDVNQNFFDVVGYSKDEVVGKYYGIFCDCDYVQSCEYWVFWEVFGWGEL